jgi:hypothetical protein
MVTQSPFLLPSSKLLRVAALYQWRKDAVLAGGAGLGDIAAAHPTRVGRPAAATPIAPTGAPQALGVARGVIAATHRSTEGIRTGRGLRPRLTAPLDDGPVCVCVR